MKWIEKIKAYCINYNIPLEYLAEVLYEPKVIPMIRGKAFEFSVMLVLERILPASIWQVDKPTINAQLGFHDIDVRVRHLSTNQTIHVECKLAKKESFRILENKHSKLEIKCMRSRTLGIGMVKQVAAKLNLDESVLAIHNDQYLPTDFDVVVTSIGNAFYRTNQQNKCFEWDPTIEEAQFLNSINDTNKDLKDFAFSRMYLAKAQDLAVKNSTGVTCTRIKCRNKKDCGFIPNYPTIEFAPNNKIPLVRWTPIEDSEELFNSLIMTT